MALERQAYLTDLLDPATFDRAGWTETLLAYEPTGEAPPFLGLLFKDEEATRKLFGAWRARLGKQDAHSELRISIVEGDVAGQKPGYTVRIAADAGAIRVRAIKEKVVLGDARIPTSSRFRRVTPPAGSTNLAEFKKHLETHKKFLLMPVLGAAGALNPAFDLEIEKTAIVFRDAADVAKAGASDPDAEVLRGRAT